MPPVQTLYPFNEKNAEIHNPPKVEPCEFERFFELAASNSIQGVLCMITATRATGDPSWSPIFENKDPATGMLVFRARDKYMPYDLFTASLTQYYKYGPAQAAANAPFAGGYRPAGAIWIWRNMQVWILPPGAPAELGFVADCNGHILTGATSMGSEFRIVLERRDHM